VFSVRNGSALLPLDTLPSGEAIQVFAITLEPAGGLEAPSTQPVLAGSVGG
jgi:hypothetical protein